MRVSSFSNRLDHKSNLKFNWSFKKGGWQATQFPGIWFMNSSPRSTQAHSARSKATAEVQNKFQNVIWGYISPMRSQTKSFRSPVGRNLHAWKLSKEGFCLFRLIHPLLFQISFQNLKQRERKGVGRERREGEKDPEEEHMIRIGETQPKKPLDKHS